MAHVGRNVGAASLVAGVLAAGAAAGVAAEKALVGRRFRRDPERDEPFGTLRGRIVDVHAPDGTLLHVEVDDPPASSPRDGLTVVFCHGFALNQDSWHYQRRDLRSLGRLVFFDQRSHGRSQRVPFDSGRLDVLGGDLLAVLEAAAPTGPVVLVGHSMGGMTVMALAAQRPELFGSRVVGVALVSTSPGGLAAVPLGLPAVAGALLHRVAPGAAAALARRKELVEKGRQRGSDVGFLLTKRYAFGHPVPPSLTEFVAEMIAATPVDVIAEFLPAFDAHDQVAALAALHPCEVLVVAGERDLLTPPSHGREIVRLVPGAELVLLPDTGHASMVERYPEVNEHLRGLVHRVRKNLAHAADAEAAPDGPDGPDAAGDDAGSGPRPGLGLPAAVGGGTGG